MNLSRRLHMWREMITVLLKVLENLRFHIVFVWTCNHCFVERLLSQIISVSQHACTYEEFIIFTKVPTTSETDKKLQTPLRAKFEIMKTAMLEDALKLLQRSRHSCTRTKTRLRSHDSPTDPTHVKDAMLQRLASASARGNHARFHLSAIGDMERTTQREQR